MQENKNYRTPDNLIHKVLMYDSVNKMVYINVFANKHRWVHEDEYCTWELIEEQMPKVYIPDIPSQIENNKDATDLHINQGQSSSEGDELRQSTGESGQDLQLPSEQTPGNAEVVKQTRKKRESKNKEI